MKNFYLIPIFFLLFSVTVSITGKASQVFTDELGRKVTLEKNPERIVSLAPNVTEILFALGLGDKIVGVTNFCNFPEEAKSKEKVGMLLNPSLEKIISLKPDLIIWNTEGENKQTFLKLSELGLKIFIISPQRIETIFDSIINIGNICGKNKNAEELVAGMKKKLNFLKKQLNGVKKTKVLFLLDLKPLISVSKNSFHGELIEFAKGENIENSSPDRYPKISMEEIVNKEPEVIIVSNHREDFKKLFNEFKNNPAVKATPAYRNNRIFEIESDLADRLSPRIVDGLERLARIIHPEVWKGKQVLNQAWKGFLTFVRSPFRG